MVSTDTHCPSNSKSIDDILTDDFFTNLLDSVPSGCRPDLSVLIQRYKKAVNDAEEANAALADVALSEHENQNRFLDE